MQRLNGKHCSKITDCNFENKKVSLNSGSIRYKDGITAEFIFSDQEKNKLGTAKLKLMGNNKAKWTLKNREGIRVGSFDYSFSVPTDIILTKVE